MKQCNVYFDLDGVLADFDAEAERLTGIAWKSFDASPAEKWAKLRDFPSFFRDLPVIPRSVEMVDLAVGLLGRENVKVLSAASVRNFPNSVQEKKDWVQQHFPQFLPENIHVVTAREDKPLFVKSQWDILVDDQYRNAVAWLEAGGRAVLYDTKYHDESVLLLNRHIECWRFWMTSSLEHEVK